MKWIAAALMLGLLAACGADGEPERPAVQVLTEQAAFA